MPNFNPFTPDTPSSESSTDSFDTSEDEQQYAPAQVRKSRSRQLINSPRRPSTSAFAYPVPKPISACLVDPFYTLPIEVDTTTNKLLHFYSQDSYWATAYALSPKIKPSIKGSWEYQAGACLSHFHILMARSALHQLRMNEKWGSEKARRELEYAALKHQTEAITLLRENVSRGPHADLKLILTSIISLATFEQRYGDRARAVLHFRTGRDIIRQIGMQDHGLNDRLREEQALWFEGIYRDPEASWMWGKEDANERLGWLKTLLREVDRMWRDRQLLPLRDKTQSRVPADSRLREFMFRETTGRSVSVYGDIDEFVAQQRCILVFVCVMCAIYEELGDSSGGLKTASKAMALNVAIRAYAAFLEDLLVEHALGPDQAVADLLWMMCQNYRDVKVHLVAAGPAAPKGALQRLDLKDCHWRASGIANVVKYLPEKRQSSLRNMLLDFIDGKPYTGKVRVNEFEFSYAGL
ncbi:hypothetical protein CLCR_07132 [Cladophialophora carrionii]|uniref:Uncharacterized protein n=1 Tax=Cladophialophora carrionii TaxID=86049 RepID=A0A1C1CNE8_9EURO|nr:hypothetical protein CLCR_07132 [Cladophialophora carrionii]